MKLKLPLLATALALLLGAGHVQALPDNVSFTEHVAPILFQNCARCHRPGEAAPFSLLTFQDAKKRGKQIIEVTQQRVMPPWHADHGYVEFSNERRLSDEQIALLGAWHRQGMKEGAAAKLPPLPQFTEGWQLGQPDLIVKIRSRLKSTPRAATSIGTSSCR